MEENNNQENSNKDKENSSLNESKEHVKTTDSKTDNAINKAEPEKLYWGKFRLADLIQFAGLLLTFGTLIAFIIVSTTQINQTEKSINNSIISDSLNQK